MLKILAIAGLVLFAAVAPAAAEGFICNGCEDSDPILIDESMETMKKAWKDAS